MLVVCFGKGKVMIYFILVKWLVLSRNVFFVVGRLVIKVVMEFVIIVLLLMVVVMVFVLIF